MKILVIDDEKSIRLSLQINLKKLGVDIFTSETGENGLEIIQSEDIDLAIVDIKLPGIDGIEVLKRIKLIKPSCIVIMITYLSEVKLAVNAMKLGAFDYFTKPFSLSEINESIKKTLEYVRIKKELNKSIPQNEVLLLGNSKKMQKIREMVCQIGSMNYNTCILLEGESGVGKEVVARTIYNVKCSNEQEFMAINCAAIPKTLQESELFGYEKGAFSDAKASKIGLIEKANGGVLFLDEVADMDLELQAKMLRVLQEKKFRRIGGLVEKEFQAVIVAATNKDLKEEIKRGNFREDLYYRLNIVPIKIPPLRERTEDISELINYFINMYNKKLDKEVISINNNALKILIEYSWPGNIRELKNMIERIMIFKVGTEIMVEDLPEEIFDNTDSDDDPNNYYNLETAEKEAIKKCLQKNNWNISHASTELGISRLTLRRKIEKYEIKK
ncbi:sigma-54 dependent transcriptional regulator [Wukongibacter baidiensis]|uniref:sigma-54-dependent transcriptional regulator n=1 Tax=Wukongibacter baidiensis TaxID=1723361 RepID=UPI003D7F93B5